MPPTRRYHTLSAQPRIRRISVALPCGTVSAHDEPGNLTSRFIKMSQASIDEPNGGRDLIEAITVPGVIRMYAVMDGKAE